ncbi:MAG: hypothetical protein ACR2MY_04875 [Candidatus Dormibacteria bacterium]
MSDRRTTVVAPAEDLDVLAHEARARGMSLGRVLGELVSESAKALRQERRPRLATFRSDVSIADASDQGDPAARPYRS